MKATCTKRKIFQEQKKMHKLEIKKKAKKEKRSTKMLEQLSGLMKSVEMFPQKNGHSKGNKLFTVKNK